MVDIVGITGSYTTDEWGVYRTETGWDANSPAPADPAFVDPPTSELHISDGSPAIAAGETVPAIVVDYDGTPRSNPPTLGAYEYIPDVQTLFSDGFESGATTRWSESVPLK